MYLMNASDTLYLVQQNSLIWLSQECIDARLLDILDYWTVPQLT